MRKRKGFTLIELLAVIVILAVIMVIAVPKILKVIENSERKAFSESAGLMAKAAELKYSESSLTSPIGNETYIYENGELTSGSPTLTFKGDKPFSGKIVQERGRVTLAVISKNKKWCAIKNEGERLAKVYKIGTDIEIEDCVIGYTSEEETYACPDISTYPGEDLTSTEIDENGNYLLDGFVYKIDTTKNEALIVAYTGPSGDEYTQKDDYIVPKTINGVPITSTYSINFKNRKFNNIILSPNLKDYSMANAIADTLNLDYAVNLTSSSYGGMSDIVLENSLTIACNTSLTQIPLNMFRSISVPKVTIKDLPNLITIGNSSFQQNQIQGEIVIKNLKNLQTIDTWAFTNGQHTSVTLENLPNLKSIGTSAFYSQNRFDLKIKGLDNLEEIGENAFDNTSITSLSFDEMPKVKTIGQFAFSWNNPSLITKIDFSKASKLSGLGSGSFGIPSDRLDVNLSGNAHPAILDYFERNGARSYNLSNNKNVTSFEPYGNSIEEVNLSGCTNISTIKMYGGGNLSNIDLSDLINLETIECQGTFPNITKIDLSNNSKLSTLNLYSLSNLKELKLGNNPLLTSMTVYSTSNLEKIVIPENVTSITMSQSPNLKCVEILGDSTRFDDNFEGIFGVTKDSVASTCTFE